MKSFVDQMATEDFNRVRSKEVFGRILNMLTPQNQELLSLDEVKRLLQPKSETYRGIQQVPIDRIVGSEGRYRDFNNRFLPRHEFMRHRWERVDKAHLSDVILPAIRLYEIGGVYFVRDGNHRVSVAASQGVMEIDAEVVSLDSEIELPPDVTKEKLLRAVIDYEKQQFYEKTGFDKLIPDYDLVFTAPGRYDEIIRHISGHKYFINQNRDAEIPFSDALVSWYENVFRPIIDIINEERLLSRFPGRTAADLYVWIVKHWHQLKERFGDYVSAKDAAIDFSDRYGKSVWQQIKTVLRRIFRRTDEHREL
jgi:hypothetical protein